MLLKRQSAVQIARSRFDSTAQSRDSVDPDNPKTIIGILPSPTPSIRGSELIKPLIFAREGSISQQARLSLSVTPFGEESKTRGPTVAFSELNYRVKSTRSPSGYKNVLNNVSGQFDWGKLSVIIGGPSSGKVSYSCIYLSIH